MAKKTRRARKGSVQIQAQPATSVTASTPAMVARPSAMNSRPNGHTVMAQAAVNFREEYHYVVSDLRRVAVLAVAMFAVLVVLALIIT
jgi:hypothetical protein